MVSSRTRCHFLKSSLVTICRFLSLHHLFCNSCIPCDGYSGSWKDVVYLTVIASSPDNKLVMNDYLDVLPKYILWCAHSPRSERAARIPLHENFCRRHSSLQHIISYIVLMGSISRYLPCKYLSAIRDSSVSECKGEKNGQNARYASVQFPRSSSTWRLWLSTLVAGWHAPPPWPDSCCSTPITFGSDNVNNYRRGS